MDLPAEGLEGWWALEAPGAAGAERSGKGGWAAMSRLSVGVSAADDPPLSIVSVPRPASVASGDGAGPEPSDPPASGESRARRFPFLTSVPDSFACLIRNSRSSASDNARRSVLPVLGFRGIKLHPTFFCLHCLHGPSGTTMQMSPALTHRAHCHRLLAPSELKGR